MKRSIFTSVVIAAMSLTCIAHADVVVNYDALSIRGNGAFGVDAMTGSGNIVLNDINGTAPSGAAIAANPLNYNLSVSNQDLDGDGMTNDSFSFTILASGSGPDPRTFNQGTDTGFGQINGVTFSVINVVGTTDQGRTVAFDGFTGARAGAGAGGDVIRNVDINGQTVTFNSPATGGFQFLVDGFDFALTNTVLFDNSGGSSGSIVARDFDLQFSSSSQAIPEPSSVALFGLVTGMMALRRRK